MIHYTGDSYGLATLDKRGGVFLHFEENVGHACWLMDEVPYYSAVECKFKAVYKRTLYALLGLSIGALLGRLTRRMRPHPAAQL